MAIQRFGSLMDDLAPQNFSSLLDRFFQDTVNSRRHSHDFMPHVDTCETDDSYQVELALPGMKKEDIRVELEEGRLTVSGERKLQQENQDKRYHRIESQYGVFQRIITLPGQVNPEKIEAAFQDGVLRINIPKEQQQNLKHRIQIKEMAAAEPKQMSQHPSSGAEQVRMNGQAAGDGANGSRKKMKT